MAEKFYSHQVNLNQKRRTRKSSNDLINKGQNPKRSLNEVFNTYYKDQVRALYRAVLDDYKW